MTLRNLMTPALVEQLRSREITVRALAAKLGVSESWLSRNYSARVIGRKPSMRLADLVHKRALTKTRREYRALLARKVLSNELSVHDAASQAACTVRTMYRCIKELK